MPIPVVLLFLALLPVSFPILGLFKPRPTYYWFLAIIMGIGVGLLIFLLPPFSQQIGSWQAEEKLAVNFLPILLRLDHGSRVLASGIIALLLAVTLAVMSQNANSTWRIWSFLFVSIILGVFSVLSGNLVTLLIAWGLLDFLALFTFFRLHRGNANNEGIFWHLVVRSCGVFTVLLALTLGGGISESFAQPEGVHAILLVACGLRIARPIAYEIHRTERKERDIIQLTLDFASVSSIFMLLSRLADIQGMLSVIHPVWLLLIGGVGIYYAARWFQGMDKENRQIENWVMSFSTLGALTALVGQSNGVVAWGLVMILSGGLFFLNRTAHRARILFFLFSIAMITVSSLVVPMGDTGNAVSWVLLGFYWTILALLVGGLIRNFVNQKPEAPGVIPGIIVLQVFGLMLLPLTFGVYALTMSSFFQITWIGLGPVIAGIGLWGWARYGQPSKPVNLRPDILLRLVPVQMFSRFFWRVYQIPAAMVNYGTLVLEGSSGILWALLLLILLISILSQSGVQ